MPIKQYTDAILLSLNVAFWYMFQSLVILDNHSFASAENIEYMLASLEVFGVSADLNGWLKASNPFQQQSWHVERLAQYD